jgi:hypothetical protein
VTRNPVFEFLRQHGAFKNENSSSTPIIGWSQPEFEWSAQTRYVPPFSYSGSSFANENVIVENILRNPHPTDILADSSLFSPKRLDLVRQLLIARKLCILPTVHAELLDLAKQPRTALQELVFPDGELNPRLELLRYPEIEGCSYITSRYTNLLHFRKRLLGGPLLQYREEHGHEASGKARTRIIQELADRGVSWRTLRLANKGDPRRRYTDETLVVYGVLSPILTGRDCFVLTADRDIFDQFYQFTQILHDDYGSYLIAGDYRSNPERYKHAHEWPTPFLQPGAITIGRALEPVELLPLIRRTCATWVIDVDSLDFMSWVAVREMDVALKFQEEAADGRVGDGGNELSVHMSLGDRQCRFAPAHFTVGQDVFAVDAETKVGRLRISNFDVYRVVSDRQPMLPSRSSVDYR